MASGSVTSESSDSSEATASLDDDQAVYGSLQSLIDRLRDTGGSPFLSLDEADLMSIVEYRGIDDFAETYCEFLDAIKTNTTLKYLEFGVFTDEAEKRALFPIINPLCRHLPKVQELQFHVTSDSSSIERFLFKDAASFTTVSIVHVEKIYDDERVLELHPNLQIFKHTNKCCTPVNGMFGPLLLSLPFPSKLRKLIREDDVATGLPWDVNMARPFTKPEFNRLVDVVQLSSLVRLDLGEIRLETEEECSRFGQGLVGSSIRHLALDFYTPESGNYRGMVSAIAKMPHLQTLWAMLYLDNKKREDDTVGSFSIPLGDVVAGVPKMKTLAIQQGWKSWNDGQCQALALALQAPTCRVTVLSIEWNPITPKMSGVKTIMSSLSAPSSSIEKFVFQVAPSWKEDIDDWLSMLPRTTRLRSLDIAAYGEMRTPVTELQQRTFFAILSQWYYLECLEGEFATALLDTNSMLQLDSLMRLNKAGRHYLLSPTPSKADGVEVLVKVRDELNDVFTHLLENPCLCDRGTVISARMTSSPMRKKSRYGSSDHP